MTIAPAKAMTAHFNFELEKKVNLLQLFFEPGPTTRLKSKKKIFFCDVSC